MNFLPNKIEVIAAKILIMILVFQIISHKFIFTAAKTPKYGKFKEIVLNTIFRFKKMYTSKSSYL